MNLLGIGPFEILLILVIATIVLGPERMAQAGRTLGRLYAQYRRRWQRDVDELTRELRQELAMLHQELEDIRRATEDQLKSTQATLGEATDAVKGIRAEMEGAADVAQALEQAAEKDEEAP